MNMQIENLVRQNIRNLEPYSCARNEFQGEASVFLDANENPLNAPYNRYPDPLQEALKEKIACLKQVDKRRIFLGNGSDEPIDLVVRIFCEPGVDNIVAIDPTYGMYKVCADINNVEYRPVALNADYSLDAQRLLAATDSCTKLIFLCSPNNPSGNLLASDEMLKVVEGFNGIVVIDEAYIDFADTTSFLSMLDRYPNMIVLQTFSKAWGMAAIRMGMAFASPEIIELFNKVKYPYNINYLAQEFVSNALNKQSEARKCETVKMLLAQREWLKEELGKLSCVQTIYPSDANFLLVKVDNSNALYTYLITCGVVVRNRHKLLLCGNCLRITVGIPEENRALIKAIEAYAKQ